MQGIESFGRRRERRKDGRGRDFIFQFDVSFLQSCPIPSEEKKGFEGEGV
jgi:hypothetical protein